MSRRILVVGFGNPLVGDDGVGPAVVERLVAGGLPPGVRAEEGGQDSLRLLSQWQGEPEVWLVDALLRGTPAGSIHQLGHQELLTVPQRHGTAHQLSLPESLRWMALACPEMQSVRFRLWGVEPERLDLVRGLTPAVEAAADAVAAEIRAAAA